MQGKNAQNVEASGEAAAPTPMPVRVLNWMRRVWRPAASVVAVSLAALLLWHGISGRNGLLVWLGKRAEDRQLRKDIDELQQENGKLREHIDRLKTDPDAINQVAHDQLHYTKPNEVIVQLPPEKKTQAQPTGAGK